jgi:hypothetical protein
MNNVITMEHIPSDAELLEIAKSAAARGFHLISNGKRSAICSLIPTGWYAMPVMIKPTIEAA